MANFSALKQSIQNYIKQNGNKEITGNILQNILLSMVTTMGDGAINDNASDISDIQNEIQNITTRLNIGASYAGYATPSTTPVALTGQEVFYLATQAGTYTNFHFNGGDDPIVLAKDGIYFIVSGNDDDDWNAEPMLQLDDEPTASSNNAVKSGGVAEELALGAVYDVSAKNPTAGPNSDGKWESLSALLSDANLNTLIPTSVRKGGMSIKFVSSVDNRYVQYRLTSTSFSISEDDWDEESDGIYDISENNGGTTYIDLATALGTNGANVPPKIKKGGVSVKFICSRFEVTKVTDATEAPSGGVNLDLGIDAGIYTYASLNSISGITGIPTVQGNSKKYYTQVDSSYTIWNVTLLTNGVAEYMQYRLLDTSWSTVISKWKCDNLAQELGTDKNIAISQYAVNHLYNDDIINITSRFVVAETGKKIYGGAIVSQNNSLYTYPVHFEKGQKIKVTLTQNYSAYQGVTILSYKNENNGYTGLVGLNNVTSGFSFEYTFFEEHDVVFSITWPTLAAKIELYQDAVLKPDEDEVKPYKYFYNKWLYFSIDSIPSVGGTFNPANIVFSSSSANYRRTYTECKEGDVFYFGKTYGKSWVITDENFVVLKKSVIDILEEYIKIPKDGKYLFCQVNRVPTEQYPHILYKKCTKEEYEDIYVPTSQVPIEATMVEYAFYPPRQNVGWDMSGNIGDIFNSTPVNGTGCPYSIDVKTGDILYLTNVNLYSDVNYLILDSRNRIIKKVVSSFYRWWAIDYKIEIPEGGTKLLWNGDTVCGLESTTGFGEVPLKDESVLPNIVKRVISNSGEGTTRRFCLSWASDTHNDVIRYKRFIDFTNKYQGCFDVVLHTGDGNRMSDQDKGFEKTVNTYKPNVHLMFALGNHDAHGQTNRNGIQVLSSGSKLWNGENYCAKFFDESTVYSADKCNFYRDFESSKIRIIVLNDYDCPRYVSSTKWVTTTDETEIASAVDWVVGTAYPAGAVIRIKGLYLKCLTASQFTDEGTAYPPSQTSALSRFDVDCVYWGQEKINFFVNALNVGQGWSIIVASHCPMEPLPSDSSKIIEKWTYRKNNTIPSIAVKYGQNGYVLQDILTAYLNRATINKTYKAITPNKVPSSGSLINQETYLPDVTVDADFTAAVGDVVCYLNGHQHCDSAFYSDHMGSLKFLTIGNINNTYKPMDIYNPWFSGDIVKGEDSRDSFNLLSVDTTEKKVYIVRVGADMTDDLSVRDYMGISYAHT